MVVRVRVRADRRRMRSLNLNLDPDLDPDLDRGPDTEPAIPRTSVRRMALTPVRRGAMHVSASPKPAWAHRRSTERRRWLCWRLSMQHQRPRHDPVGAVAQMERSELLM